MSSSLKQQAIFTRFYIGTSVERVLTICSNGSIKALKISSPEKSSSQEPRKFWGWMLIYSIGDSRSTKFVQMMVIGWSLIFLQPDHICAPIYLFGENVEKIFSQYVLKTKSWNLQSLFVLRFYGPGNPMESCRARSVYLTTGLLGRLSPLSG